MYSAAEALSNAIAIFTFIWIVEQELKHPGERIADRVRTGIVSIRPFLCEVRCNCSITVGQVPSTEAPLYQ